MVGSTWHTAAILKGRHQFHNKNWRQGTISYLFQVDYKTQRTFKQEVSDSKKQENLLRSAIKGTHTRGSIDREGSLLSTRWYSLLPNRQYLTTSCDLGSQSNHRTCLYLNVQTLSYCWESSSSKRMPLSRYDSTALS